MFDFKPSLISNDINKICDINPNPLFTSYNEAIAIISELHFLPPL